MHIYKNKPYYIEEDYYDKLDKKQRIEEKKKSLMTKVIEMSRNRWRVYPDRLFNPLIKWLAEFQGCIKFPVLIQWMNCSQKAECKL